MKRPGWTLTENGCFRVPWNRYELRELVEVWFRPVRRLARWLRGTDDQDGAS